MKNISISDTIETLTMGIQAGFIDTMNEIDSISSIVSGVGRCFLKECEETDTPPTDEITEVISALESFLAAIVNNPSVDFVDEEESHGICLSIVDIVRALLDLKIFLKF